MTARKRAFRTKAGERHRRHKLYACKRCGCEVDLFARAFPVKCHSGCNSYGFRILQLGHDTRTRPLKSGSMPSCALNPGVSGEGDS